MTCGKDELKLEGESNNKEKTENDYNMKVCCMIQGEIGGGRYLCKSTEISECPLMILESTNRFNHIFAG